MDSHPSPVASSSLRPIKLSHAILAGFTLFLATVGQSYVLWSSPASAQSDVYVSAKDMIAVAVAFLSTLGGSWLIDMTKSSRAAVQLDLESRSPLIGTFVDEKQDTSLPPASTPLDIRAAQAGYLPYFIAGNVCLGESGI